MNERRVRLVKWALGVAWAAFTFVAFSGWRSFGAGGIALVYQAVTLSAVFIIGSVAGYVLERLARRTGLLLGGLLGHVAFAPPAVQLAQWAGQSIPELLLPFFSNAMPALIAAAAVYMSVAVVVLCVGSAAGTGLHAAIRLAAIRFFPRFASRVAGWRPSWRMLRISILSAILLGVIFYADKLGVIPWPEAKPPANSEWIEREKSLFRDVLARGRYDMLVLPVQADGPTFDRVARSLMTRYLARRASERTGARLPDTTLLSRALDSRARRIDLEDALRLAESVGARIVVASEVRRKGQAFTFRAQLWARADDKSPWQKGAAGALEGLPFNDRLPPSITFRDSIDPLFDQLKLGVARAPATQPSPAAIEAQPIDDLLKLAASEPASAAESALRLQVLASLHARGSLEAQTLWERSLVALWRASGPSALDRMLEARAYLHLFRRPYALERLGKPESPAERALLAALNADVPGVEAAIGAIDDRALRLMAEIELADLYEADSLLPRLTVRRRALLEPAWTEAVTLRFRLSAPEWFNPEAHEQVAVALERLLPVSLDWGETAGAWFHWLYRWPDPLTAQDLRLARSIERRYSEAWTKRAADWETRPAADRPAEWDYYELLFAINREAVLKSVRSVLDLQALPRQAAETIDALGSTFAGEPELTYLHARALDKLGQESLLGEHPRLSSKSSALAVSVYRWEGGETRVSSNAEYYIYERNYEKYADEPIRWYRTEVPTMRLSGERLYYSSREIDRAIAESKRRLEYSDGNTRPLRELVRWLRRADRAEEAAAAVEANKDRFVGTVARPELHSEVRRAAGRRRQETLAPFHELLELDPNSWSARWRLGKAYMEGGEPERAQALFLGYPGFTRADDNERVALSNHAFEAGHYFYKLGEQTLGQPLLKLSSGMQTGSARQMHSDELLALMGNDVLSALSQARRQLDRYNNGNAGGRYLLYLFLLGRQDQAWSEFTTLANRFGDENVWTAAFVAHRMQGLESGALERWLAQDAARDRRRDYLTNALRERHAFMLSFIDRPPADESLQLVRRVTQANNQSPFYTDLAEGYLAFRRGDYAQAAQKMRGNHNDLFSIGVSRGSSYSDLLPYLAVAYLRSGQRAEAEKLLAQQQANLGDDSDYLVARALLDGFAGKDQDAVASLRLAFYRLPLTLTRSFYPGYTLLEACELLLQQSGKEIYRDLIEDFARRLQMEVPYSWAAAFEAKYARDPDARRVALAAASILDPKSERLAGFPDSERSAARGAALRHGGVLGAVLRRASR